MTWSPEVSTANQTAQWGAEVDPGTAVAASKRVDCFTIKDGIKPERKSTTGTGRKYPSVQQLNSERTEGSIDGSMDFNGILYPACGALGKISPVAHGSSAVAKDWILPASLGGSIQPQTYTVEKGEAATRAHKYSYMLINKFGYKFNRKTDASVSGGWVAQRTTDGITMTGSPTAVPLVPMTGQEFNVYLDTTAAALGTTQLLKVLEAEFSMDNIYNPAWYINRANSSFSAHVDTNPTAMVKFKVAADATGMSLVDLLRSGASRFMRIEAVGDIIDNTWTVSLGSPSAGTFTLTYKGQTTSGVAFNATNATVQAALTGLSTVGAGNATVSGSAGGPYTVTFTGALASDTTALTGSGASLTGGTFLITSTQVFHTFWHDLCIKIGDPDPWEDADGVYAIGYSCEVFEDATWANAHKITVTNKLTAL